MTRIIGGELAGRRLAVPDSARPTTDRVREAMFSSLLHRIGDWGTCEVLDLFAGSGALGLEAVSRGAAHATFVERDRAALSILRANLRNLAPAGRTTVAAADVLRWRPPPGASYGVVFVDPPYELLSTSIAGALAGLERAGALAPNAVVVVERPARVDDVPLPQGWAPVDRRRYGDTVLWYGHAQDTVANMEGT